MARSLGLIMACLLLFLTAGRAAAEDELASLNLRDVDIRVLIDTVSEATGRNFLVDPRVKAKVTLISSKPMPKGELYEVFLSILQLHGFSAVPAGKVIKIVPDANAKQEAVPTVNGYEPEAGDQLVTRVVEVEHVAAAQLVPILRPLIPQQGHLAAYPATNVLIISDRAANISRIADIVKRIDRAESDEIEVIRLQHASAPELVRVINGLQQQSQQARQAPGGAVLAADERTNSILLGGDPSARLRMRGLIAHLDTPLDAGGNTQVIFLKYAKAEDMAAILEGTVEITQQGGGQQPSPGRQEVDIQADEVNNALVITAPPDILRNLRAVIRQLDIRRAQVLVEAVIAEVSTDVSRELGVQYFFDGREGDDRGAAAITNFGPTGTSLLSLIDEPTSFGTGIGLAVGNLTAGEKNWLLLVKALAGDAATNILSTPSILTMDNQEAEIVVGQNVPFVTGQFTSTGSGDGVQNPFQTIERQDVGLTLKVTPQLNEGSSIQLEISQEVSSIASTSVSTSDVVTNKRSIKTTVNVEDSQIVVLGGLIDDNFQDSEQKVPILGDMPVLGPLFRFTSTKKTKQNLMVFIHPMIVRNPETAEYYSGQKYSYLRARQLDAEIRSRGLLYDDAARLPERIDDLRDLMRPFPRGGSAGEGDLPAAGEGAGR